MPVSQDFTVTAERVAKGDLLNGHEIDAVKVGRKWVDLTGLTGHRVARVEIGTELTVQRDVPTDEEKAAEAAAREQEYIGKTAEWLQNDLSARLAATPQALLAELAQQENGFNLLDSWTLNKLVTCQAKYDFAARVEGVMSNWAKRDELPDVAKRYPPIIAAWAMVIATHLENARYANPLSRSTSTLSNLVDDMQVHTAYNETGSFRSAIVKRVVLEIQMSKELEF